MLIVREFERQWECGSSLEGLHLEVDLAYDHQLHVVLELIVQAHLPLKIVINLNMMGVCYLHLRNDINLVREACIIHEPHDALVLVLYARRLHDELIRH